MLYVDEIAGRQKYGFCCTNTDGYAIRPTLACPILIEVGCHSNVVEDVEGILWEPLDASVVPSRLATSCIETACHDCARHGRDVTRFRVTLANADGTPRARARPHEFCTLQRHAEGVTGIYVQCYRHARFLNGALDGFFAYLSDVCGERSNRLLVDGFDMLYW